MRPAFARVAELAEQIRGVSYGKQDASTTQLPGYLPILRAGNITDDESLLIKRFVVTMS